MRGTPARRQQPEQFAPLGVEVLHGWQLGPGDAPGKFSPPCVEYNTVEGGAPAKSGG